MIKCYIYIVFYKSGLRVAKDWKPWDLRYLTFSSSSQNSMSTQHVGYKSFLHWMSIKSSSSETWKEHLEVHTMVTKSFSSPYFRFETPVFVFLSLPPSRIFFARVRNGSRYQIGWIFGKDSRGGGGGGGGAVGSFSIQKFIFREFKQGFLGMELERVSNFRIQGMFLQISAFFLFLNIRKGRLPYIRPVGRLVGRLVGRRHH